MEKPLAKNDDITLEITGMSSEGAGVGRHEGFAVFVPYALPGEKVDVHIIKVASSYAVGKLTSVIKAAPQRVVPPCPSYKKCGGCSLQHMSYEAQLEFKRAQVKDALERIGGFNGVYVRHTIGMSEPLRCRNKGSFPFAEAEGEPRWGLYAARSHRLIETGDCIIERQEAITAAEAVREWAKVNQVSAYNEESCTGILRHVITRTLTGGTAVCVVTTGELPSEGDLIARLQTALPNVRSIVHNINRRDTNVICGDEYRVIWGASAVEQSICGLDFEVSAESFLQVNPVQTEVLYGLAMEGLDLGGDETVADVFCGIGTISLLLAKHAKSVVGIEYVEKAIEDAKRNAQRNGISNAEFFCGAAERVLPRLVRDGRRFEAVTLDPPRKGADPAVLDAVILSGAKRIAYVSCNPATLARDLKILRAGGYTLDSVQPVDMFPMTSHVETVVLMSRVDGK